MAIQAECSLCGEKYTLADTMSGKIVKCRECKGQFNVPKLPKAEEEMEDLLPLEESEPEGGLSREPRRGEPAKAKPSLSRRRSWSQGRHDDDDDDRRERGARSSRKAAPASNGTLIGLVIGAGVLMLLVLGGAVLMARVYFTPSTPPPMAGPPMEAPFNPQINPAIRPPEVQWPGDRPNLPDVNNELARAKKRADDIIKRSQDDHRKMLEEMERQRREHLGRPPIGNAPGMIGPGFRGDIPGGPIGGAPGVQIGGVPGAQIGGMPGAQIGGPPGANFGGVPGAQIGGMPGVQIGGVPGAQIGGNPGVPGGRRPRQIPGSMKEESFKNVTWSMKVDAPAATIPELKLPKDPVLKLELMGKWGFSTRPSPYFIKTIGKEVFQVFDLTKWQPVGKPFTPSNRNPFETPAIDPAGEYVATRSFSTGEVTVYAVAKGEKIACNAPSCSGHDGFVDFLDKRRLLVVASKHDVLRYTVWNVEKNTEEISFAQSARLVPLGQVFSPTAKYLALVDRHAAFHLYFLNLKTGSLEGSIALDSGESTAMLLGMSFSPDGKKFTVLRHELKERSTFFLTTWNIETNKNDSEVKLAEELRYWHPLSHRRGSNLQWQPNGKGLLVYQQLLVDESGTVRKRFEVDHLDKTHRVFVGNEWITNVTRGLEPQLTLQAVPK
jgi:hypothetical protein